MKNGLRNGTRSTMRNDMKNSIRNRGTATVEMCFVMPIIVFLCMAVVQLFLDSIGDGIVQGESYTAIYTYDGTEHENGGIYKRPVVLNQNHICSDGSVPVKKETACEYRGRNTVYRTEYDLCSSRLRRWQLYGDVLRE